MELGTIGNMSENMDAAKVWKRDRGALRTERRPSNSINRQLGVNQTAVAKTLMRGGPK